MTNEGQTQNKLSQLEELLLFVFHAFLGSLGIEHGQAGFLFVATSVSVSNILQKDDLCRKGQERGWFQR